MALELKSLRASALKLQARIDRLNALAARADEKGAMLEGHYGDIEKQLGAHVDDIEFAANVLGNSGGHSDVAEEPVQKPAALPATQPTPTYFDAPAIPPAVSEMGLNTFRAQAEAQIAAGHKAD